MKSRPQDASSALPGAQGHSREGKGRTEGPAAGLADFEALYQRHSREVWALAYARWMNAETAQDIMQEAFLRLWKQRREGTRILNPRAWLLRVARNLAEDHAKSAFSRNGTQPPQTMNGVEAKGRPPLERLEQQETFAQVRAILKQMPEADREILTLRYALDYDSEEIAEVLAIQVTAVHMRLSRARQRLAERLTGQGIEGAP
jgi:RNA polymerase sigma-70 factor (ECF subfamily)